MANENPGLKGKFISVRGVVQGVGFRPFVYQLAHKHGLTGWVLNHSGGVDIEVEGLLSSLTSPTIGLTPPWVSSRCAPTVSENMMTRWTGDSMRNPTPARCVGRRCGWSFHVSRLSGDAISQAAELLREGAIVALKGLGGFHLACDATNAEVVARLRERKGRPHKSLAVMMATLEEIQHHCQVSEAEEELLTSRECPIVLLPWREESDVARNVAPGYRHLGVMLPYTPLHHVLLRDVGRPLVMTSGNLSEEPICQTNEEALERLAHIADTFLLHNRDIYARYDDSV